jgi:hypothetical protein
MQPSAKTLISVTTAETITSISNFINSELQANKQPPAERIRHVASDASTR